MVKGSFLGFVLIFLIASGALLSSPVAGEGTPPPKKCHKDEDCVPGCRAGFPVCINGLCVCEGAAAAPVVLGGRKIGNPGFPPLPHRCFSCSSSGDLVSHRLEGLLLLGRHLWHRQVTVPVVVPLPSGEAVSFPDPDGKSSGQDGF
ncbi:hypothetical protein CRG98_022474 [Punica granatum]|uniref:Uncharacterized protein n=1 Tax=Punica granatum TaxID=22663 RepID=A0A2I0JLL6_PUNGR|nr:hypothetical protein CRG98_022474 [Punica granatum]